MDEKDLGQVSDLVQKAVTKGWFDLARDLKNIRESLRRRLYDERLKNEFKEPPYTSAE